MQLVKSEVRPEAKIVVVGEAPGAKEEAAGRPFIGPAGQLLIQLFAQAQISRSELTLTNVFKTRPENNDVTCWLNVLGKKATETAIFRESREILREELRLWKPNVVVAAGGVALYTLTGKLGLLKWRGSILESTLVPGLKVIPTIHPSAALRQQIFKYYIVFDLKRVKQEALTPEIKLLERRLIIEPTFNMVVNFFQDIKSPVAFDIEVSNRELSCIAYSYDPTEAFCIPFLGPNGHYWSYEEEVEVWRMIKKLHEDSSIKKVAQNGIFDITFLAEKCGIYTAGFQGDTMIAFHHLFPGFSKDLGFIASICTREPYYKYQLAESKGGMG
jgi:uracil-DNA glycosylase family 4